MSKSQQINKRGFPLTHTVCLQNEDIDRKMSRRYPIDREFSVEASKPGDQFIEVLGPFALHEALHAADEFGREYIVDICVIAHDFPEC